LQPLLNVAKKVQKDAKQVTTEDISHAKAAGFTERDIHDAVLIAAAFCMFNRYVDGLGTFAPPIGHESYLEMGKMLATKGYAKALD
jgi:alkylhydroperoxidase family enzyme